MTNPTVSQIQEIRKLHVAGGSLTALTVNRVLDQVQDIICQHTSCTENATCAQEIRAEHTDAPVNYHAATAAYVRLGFDKDGKTIEGNIYDLIKQVVDAAIKPSEISICSAHQERQKDCPLCNPFPSEILDNKCPDCGSEMIEVCSGLEGLCKSHHEPVMVSLEKCADALRNMSHVMYQTTTEDYAKAVLDAAGVKYHE